MHPTEHQFEIVLILPISTEYFSGSEEGKSYHAETVKTREKVIDVSHSSVKKQTKNIPELLQK